MYSRPVRAWPPVIALACACGDRAPATSDVSTVAAATRTTFRTATFNASLYRDHAGELLADLQAGDEQAHRVAEVVQRVAPDILVLNEFDEDADAVELFRTAYLGVPHGDAAAIVYEHVHQPRCNTGVPSGLDLDRDGRIEGANDAWGFGAFPGQYCFVVFSRFPLRSDLARTFATLRWADMPEHRMPRGFWPDEIAAQLRLSSKTLLDLPAELPGDGGYARVHVLVHHPTPPTFDGPEDRNGRRNHDEIRLLAEVVGNAAWLVDDAGIAGGLPAGEAFVIHGDANADPFDGDSVPGAIAQLLEHPRVDASFVPKSAGAIEKAAKDGGANAKHTGDPAHDTADFSDRTAGNLRVDYVLPSRELEVTGGGVYWPTLGETHAALATVSDHHAVWLDLRLR